MKVFDVYKHPVKGYQAVKHGFGWPAFFFNFWWAFFKKLWGLGFALFGVGFLLILLQDKYERAGNEDGVVTMGLMVLGFVIVVGIMGNGWRREHLVKNGFDQLNTVEAETPDAAISLVAKKSAG